MSDVHHGFRTTSYGLRTTEGASPSELEARARRDYENRRRLQLYLVSRDNLVDILSGRVEIVEPALPADASIANVAYDYASDSLAVAVRSDEFATVPAGDLIPNTGLAMKLYSHPKGLMPRDKGESS